MKLGSKQAKGTTGLLLGSAFFCALFFVGIFWLAGQGCQQKSAPTSSMILTPCPTPILFLGFEDLTPTPAAGNGVTFFTSSSGVIFNDPGTGSIPTTYTSKLSLSALYATQGLNSLDVAVTQAESYNQNLLILTFNNPVIWANVSALTMDVTVDPSVVAGANWSSLQFVADSASAGLYFRTITNTSPKLSAGSQTLTWFINWTDSPTPYLQPTDTISKLTFIYNRSNPSPGQGIGNIYIDNVQLIQNCP
jgi:hypothetical protein